MAHDSEGEHNTFSGDTVRIAAGTYTDQIRPANNDTSSARITYMAHGNGNVILTNVGNLGSMWFEDVGAIALGGRSFVTVDGVNQSIRVLPGAVIYSGLGNVSNASNCIVNSIYCDGSTTLSLGSRVFMFNSLYGGNGESKFNALTNSYLSWTYYSRQWNSLCGRCNRSRW